MSVLGGIDPEFEYAEECYTYLVCREKHRVLFRNRSPQIEFRDELVSIIRKLCLKYKLSLRVKYLTIYILDYFMDNHQILKDRLQLILVCSLLIAAKVDENDNRIPKYKELLSAPNLYSKNEYLEMESKILQFFDWIFLTPITTNYIEYFCCKCFDEKQFNAKTVKQIAEKYLEKTIDTKFYKFYPSIIAASIIFCTRDNLGFDSNWPKYVQNITKYTSIQITECVRELKSCDIKKTVMTRIPDNCLNDSGFIDINF